MIMALHCLAEEVTEDSLKILPQLTFMEFGSKSCIPCKQMEKVMEQIKVEYPKQVAVIFVDVRKERAKAKEYKIRIIPTQIIFDANGKEILRHKGYFPFNKVKELFAENNVFPITKKE